jgi:hypothetical protein
MLLVSHPKPMAFEVFFHFLIDMHSFRTRRIFCSFLYVIADALVRCGLGILLGLGDELLDAKVRKRSRAGVSQPQGGGVHGAS